MVLMLAATVPALSYSTWVFHLFGVLFTVSDDLSMFTIVVDPSAHPHLYESCVHFPEYIRVGVVTNTILNGEATSNLQLTSVL